MIGFETSLFRSDFDVRVSVGIIVNNLYLFVFATGCDVNEKEIDFNGCETACKGKGISSFVFG